MNKYLEKVKSFMLKIVTFYVEPYSGVNISVPSKKINKKEKRKNKQKNKEEISGTTTMQVFIDYYKKNTLSVLLQVLSSLILVVSVGLALFFFFKVLVLAQPWAIILIAVIVSYSIIKPGLYYLFERKKEVTTGLFSMIGDYIENSDTVSFKNYVENLDTSRYPKMFIEEFLNPMIKTMQTTYSESALKEQLNLPRNNYYEIEKYKDFIIKAVASNDQSIRKALKVAIETSKESKKTYIDKMKATGFIVYLAIGFALIFPGIFIGIFITTLSGVGLAGLTTSAMLPTALTFNLWFLNIVFSSTALIIGITYYTNQEGKAVVNGQYALIGLTIVSMVLYGIILVL
jgi:hypothetical protein